MKSLRQRPIPKSDRSYLDRLDGAIHRYVRHGSPIPEGVEIVEMAGHHAVHSVLTIEYAEAVA